MPKFKFEQFPVLSPLLRDAGLKLVDVGGRGSAFAPLVSLAPHAHYYVAEPDRAEAERLERELRAEAAWRDVTVLTEAIAARRGEALLYLTARPGMSSLIEPDPGVTGLFYLGHRFRVVRTITVPTIPLDDAAATYGFADACFLKLDTQGSELEILQSGERLVRESLLGVYVECSFRPFYKGQALFSDVDSYLRDNGFALFTLSRTNLRRAGYRPAMYSRRVTAWAHCLYLREPETLAGDVETLRHDVARMLSLALVFEQYDLAFELVALARRAQLLAEPDLTQLGAEVERCIAIKTRSVIRRGEEKGLVEELMASAFRDKRNLE